MEEYFSGKKLYGDDFSIEQIRIWYNQESEAYANLGSKNKGNYNYGYHALNYVHGFSKLKQIKKFAHVLGFGAAWGHELIPIIEKISKLTIVEPSEHLRSKNIKHLIPQYYKPTIDGKLIFSDNSFDLITCFGTLHHIPNVTFVLSELIRVLKPNGYLLLREPIVSMGDWRYKRNGLTKNERGIPLLIFENIFKANNLKIIAKNFCIFSPGLIEKLIGKFFRNSRYNSYLYVHFDKIICNLLKSNIKYHRIKTIDKIGPTSIFYVVKKI